MNWNELNSISQLEELESESKEIPVLIFKHSTRCSISSMAKNRLERDWDSSSLIKSYYLDLIAFRDVSNEVAVRYDVFHQSPQAILLKNGKAVYDASHNAINFSDIKAQ